MKKRIGQSLSIDLLIAVMIFLAVIGIFYYLSTRTTPAEDGELLQSEALKLSTKLQDPNELGVIDEYRNLDIDKLEELYEKNASELQRELGLRSRFCIYIIDSNGDILVINNRNGVGFSDISIDGVPCGQIIG